MFNSTYGKLNLASSSEPLAGFELRMVIGGDGNSYRLSLQDKEDTACRYGFFTDERGLIYHGKVIDCRVN